MVVDDVEYDFEAGGVEGLDHLLELGNLSTGVSRRAVAGHGREVPEGVVATVVGEAAIDEVAVVDEVVDGQEFDGGDTELLEVVDAGFAGEAGVGAAEMLGHHGIALRVALDVHLIDDGVGEWSLRGAVVAPVEVVIDDDALGDTVG